MESPRLYENNLEQVKKISSAPGALKVKQYRYPDDSYIELADLNTPEISLDLQGLIESDGLFTDLLNKQGSQNRQLGPHLVSSSIANSTTALNYSPGTFDPRLEYMPQPVHSGHNSARFNSPQAAHSIPPVNVKEEPGDPQDFGTCRLQSQGSSASVPYTSVPYTTVGTNLVSSTSAGVPSVYTTLTPSTVPGADGHSSLRAVSQVSSRGVKKTKPVDKASDDYRRRRERNNVAVRKSREKAKIRSKETEDRVKALNRENERLQKRVELLTEELNVLRELYTNVGILPEHLHRDICEHVKSLQEQQQSLANL